MKIHVEHFRNIDSLDFEIPDSKVSFLYGISGTGKSSLIKAMSRAANERDVPVGKPGATPMATINGAMPDYENVRVYNESSVTSLILNPVENENAYSALVGDESELKKLEDDYKRSIGDLRSHLGDMLGRRDKILSLIKAFGPIEDDGRLSRKAGTRKIEAELHGAKATPASKSLLKKDPKYIKFIGDGAKLPQYSAGKCPFCERKLSPSRTATIESIRSATQSTFKMLFDNTSLFSDLGITEPVWTHKRSYSKLEKVLYGQARILNELEELIGFCQAPDGGIVEYVMPKELHVSKELLDCLPKLGTPVSAVNSSISRYKKMIGQMKSEFNKLVKGKTKQLNADIALLGIPYKVEATNLDRSSKKVSYRIAHVADPSKGESGDRLSSGEKNVLALLIFAMNKTAGLVIFDDPVSSYDEYRRSQLYKHILNKTDSTVIVCSHDQSFIKQALIDKSQASIQSKRIGLIGVFDNHHGKGLVKELSVSDFGSLRSFVFDRIKFNGASDYYRSMINLRLLCEIDGWNRKGSVKRAAWGYASAVLHGRSRNDILDKLAEKGVTEDGIIAELDKEYGLAVPRVPAQYSSVVDGTYTTFERIIIGREQKGIGSINKCVLDDIVHLNNNLVVCLNPYEYTDYPKYIVDKVDRIVSAAN